MSILKTLYESESCVNENINLNYTLNNYQALKENLQVVPTRYYTDPAFVRVVRENSEKSDSGYLILLDDIVKVSKGNSINILNAIEEVLAANSTDDITLDKDNVKIIVTDIDDVDDLEKNCKSDPTTLRQKVNKIQEFVDTILSIEDEGYTVVKNNH